MENMNIAIASGKGGTGKTTIATNLALSLQNVQLIDCDVEEPNANIFLQTQIKEREEVTIKIPIIDKKKCDFCGKCADFCAYNALAVVGSKVLLFPELCHSCGGCQIVCPREAINWTERLIGKVEHGIGNNLDFYHGILNIGEAMTLPLIKSLKKKINKNKHVILDAPPGTSCPVIETINNSDYCILVTEPTPFGLYDLKLAVEVVNHLHIPFGVIINRDGIGNNNVELYCHKEKIPILLKIPHSEEIAQLYSQGIPFIKKLTQWQYEFNQLFTQIKEETLT
jgi:MinD superfamily P-loop ATPase